MRRLAPLLLLALVAVAHADSAAYLKLRRAKGIVQTVGAAALRTTKAPKVVEIAGIPVGTCQSADSTLLILRFEDGVEQEIESKNLPEWLATTSDPVRLIVRCTREGGPLKVTLLDGAPELDVLPVEEAYWRTVARKTNPKVTRREAKPVASRSNVLRGPIGRNRRAAPVSSSQVAPIYAAFIKGQNPRLTNAKALGIANDVIRFSLGYGVDARLVMAILMVESGFDPNAVSHSGAVGLGQLMPGTAKWMGVQNSYDTTQNLYGMIKLLNTHSRQFNRSPDDPLVLAAYNAGEGAVRRHGGVPPFRETQAYVKRVTAYYQALRGY